MLFKKPRFDPANNWRFRYHVGYLVLCGIVSVADLGFAAVTKLYDLGTPSCEFFVPVFPLSPPSSFSSPFASFEAVLTHICSPDVYGVALVVSLIEGALRLRPSVVSHADNSHRKGLYIAIAVVCIEFHVGTKTRIDLGKELGVRRPISLSMFSSY